MKLNKHIKEIIMKEETLEEAAESYAEKWNDLENQFKLSSCFIAGAKWQQERSYSEEDIAEKLFNHPAMCAIRDSKSDAEARRIILHLLKNK